MTLIQNDEEERKESLAEEVELGEEKRDETKENIDLNWFMVSTISGREWTVKETLESRAKIDGLTEQLREIKLYELSCKGEVKQKEKMAQGLKRIAKQENMYPGYIFIKADMSDRLWYVIRNTKYVTGLIGSSGKGAYPTKISDWKIKNYDKLYKERQAAYCQEVISRSRLTSGMLVKIIGGPYKGHMGKVYSSRPEQALSYITIDFFGKRITREIEDNNLEVVQV